MGSEMCIRDSIWLVDDSPPEGCAPSELLPPDIIVGDRLEVREPLTVVSGDRQGASGVNCVEEHPGSVLVIRAPWGSISFLDVDGAR